MEKKESASMIDLRNRLRMSAQMDMFSSREEREIEESAGRLMNINISDLIEFRDHTFQVRNDEDMVRLQESIRDNGVMEPIIAFPNEDGQLEIVSGHRRVFACDNLGIETVPVLVKYIDRDMATVIMGATNLERRSNILPSEKAATYEAMFQSLKRQGKRTDLFGSDTQSAHEKLSQLVSESAAMIDRYRALNGLIPQLMDLVDKGRIKVKPAYELSYIRPESQKEIYNFYEEFDSTPSHAQAKMLRELDKNNILTQDKILEILKKPKETQEKPFTLSEGLRAKYFSDCITQKDMENKIIRALKLLETQERIESGISR